MWETIKNDPLLKTFAILILGIIAFGLTFNIMFGAGGGEMSGYSLNNSLSNLWTFLIKLLFIAVVLVILFAVAKAAKTYLFDRSDSKMSEYLKDNPIIKALAVALIAILVLGVTVFMFNSILGAPMGNYGMYRGMGFSLQVLLMLLVKLLLFISVIGLIVGIGMYLVQNKEILNRLVVKQNPKAGTAPDFCKTCGAELKVQWVCCPNCGSQKEKTIELAEEVKAAEEKSETAVVEVVEAAKEEVPAVEIEEPAKEAIAVVELLPEVKEEPAVIETVEKEEEVITAIESTEETKEEVKKELVKETFYGKKKNQKR